MKSLCFAFGDEAGHGFVAYNITLNYDPKGVLTVGPFDDFHDAPLM
jgi:hypothetical protein